MSRSAPVTGPFEARGEAPATVSPFGSGCLRYVTVVRDPAGGLRYYFEAARADGGHDLRTQHVPGSA